MESPRGNYILLLALLFPATGVDSECLFFDQALLALLSLGLVVRNTKAKVSDGHHGTKAGMGSEYDEVL